MAKDTRKKASQTLEHCRKKFAANPNDNDARKLYHIAKEQLKNLHDYIVPQTSIQILLPYAL